MKISSENSAISVKEVCLLLSISPATLYRRIGDDSLFPRPFKVGGKSTRFFLRDVLAYLEKCAGNTQTPTQEANAPRVDDASSKLDPPAPVKSDDFDSDSDPCAAVA